MEVAVNVVVERSEPLVLRPFVHPGSLPVLKSTYQLATFLSTLR